MSLPFEDLLKDSSESFEDGNYFIVTITELELGTTYPLQFKWKYKDGTLGKDWSASYNINTPIKTVPNQPKLLVTDVVGGGRFIKVTWSGQDSAGNTLSNIDRVDIHISGTSFGDGTKPAGSFKIAGTQTFTAEPGVYIVQLKSVTVNGETSFFSDARTVTVTDVGEVIQTPTLPTGLSVATAPFAVTVNWTGQYSSSTFTGFKSIDIYAVSSDLGSSVTSGITTTNLVGSLTVNNTPNKINISLDNLRQALGLTNNSDVYNATIFYYYNATNRDGTRFGSPTYTRINSSSVIPTKANFVDLANGVISIENLVAGNGAFSSWLRTGSAGGARIELSAVNNFTNGGYTVQKGLTAYSSGNTEIFKLDLSTGNLTINGSGTFSGSLSAASGTFTGTLSAATGSFSGTITASAGSIGGLTIASNSLSNTAGTFSLDSGGKARFGSSTGNAIIIDPAAGVGSAYIYHSTNGGSSASGKFTVGTDGTLTITGANVTGSITSTSGTIGGWTIGSTTITGGSTTLNSNGSITTSNFSVGTNGAITSTLGTIGGWTIGSNGLTSSTVELKSSSASGLNPNGAVIVKGSLEKYLFGGDNSSMAIININAAETQQFNIISFSPGIYQTTIGTSSGYIVANGNFYAGTVDASPSAQTAGISLASDGQLNVRRSGDTPLNVHRYTGTGTRRMVTFWLSGAGAGGIQANGTTEPTFAAPSDYRLKENVRDFTGAMDKIKLAKLKIFNFKHLPEKDVVGFIAHELAEIDPDLATGVKDEVDKDGNPIYQDAMPGGLVKYLAAALKEAILKIEELEQRLDALEG